MNKIKCFDDRKIIIYSNNGNWHIDSSKMLNDEEALHLMIETTIAMYQHIVENANKKGFLETMEIYYERNMERYKKL